MKHRLNFSRVTGVLVVSSLMVISPTVAADGYYSQQYPQDSQQGSNRQPEHRRVNPWQLPLKKEKDAEFRVHPDNQAPQYNESQQPQNNQQLDQQLDQQKQGFRFVTPEILESLKQQQSEYQKMPGNKKNPQYRLPQPWQGGYGYSPYGTGYPDPLLGTPGFSPWGGVYPWAPYGGIGGITTVPVPTFEGNSNSDDSNNPDNQEIYDVFDPFTLLPNGN